MLWVAKHEVCHLHKLSHNVPPGMSDIEGWTIQKRKKKKKKEEKLKLNEEKTKAMVLGKPSVLDGDSGVAVGVAGCQITFFF